MTRNWANIPFKPAAWPFFYGWVIVACSSIGIIASVPGQTIGVGVFVDYLSEAMALSSNDLSTVYLIATLVSSLVMPFAGRLLDRWGARVSAILAAAGLGASLCGFAWCTRISPTGDIAWFRAMFTICVLFFGIRFFGQGSLTLVSRVMLARWFEHRRGLATSISGIFVSIAFTGGGAWILNFIVVQLGWQQAYIAMALAIGLGVAGLAALLFRDNPEDCGLPRDGFNVSATRRKTSAVFAVKERTALEALRTLPFWAFNLGLALHAMLMTAVAFHLASLGDAYGLDRAATYAVLLPMPIFSISGSFLCGWMCDRFNQKWSLLLMTTSLTLGVAMIPAINTFAGKVGIIAGLGISGGCFGVVSTVVFPHFYGQKHLGAINGVSMFVVVSASALGPKFFSLFVGHTGDFRFALFVSCLMPLVIAALSLFVPRPESGPTPSRSDEMPVR